MDIKPIHTLWIICSLAAIAYFGYRSFEEQAGRNEEYAAYQKAYSSTSREEIQQFMNQYPQSKYREVLEYRILQLNQEEKQWKELLLYGTAPDFELFIRENPQSVYIAQAKELVDSLDWLDAKRSGTGTAISAYLKKHPNGSYVKEALRKQKKLN